MEYTYSEGLASMMVERSAVRMVVSVTAVAAATAGRGAAILLAAPARCDVWRAYQPPQRSGLLGNRVDKISPRHDHEGIHRGNGPIAYVVVNISQTPAIFPSTFPLY